MPQRHILRPCWFELASDSKRRTFGYTPNQQLECAQFASLTLSWSIARTVRSPICNENQVCYGSTSAIFDRLKFRPLCPSQRTSKSRISKIREWTAAYPSTPDVKSCRRFRPRLFPFDRFAAFQTSPLRACAALQTIEERSNKMERRAASPRYQHSDWELYVF